MGVSTQSTWGVLAHSSPRMAALLHVLLLLSCLLVSVPALRCRPPCPKGQPGPFCYVCPTLDPEDCVSKELVIGPCGCEECAKAMDETCGGPWDIYGKCAKDLVCATQGEYELEGFCREE